ncbi:hypothetical protein CI238_07937 [Colletotrichum incanum]|uniref:Uncharacterized protein n=1 Tax=Colletotrichum incanum TaxID=1573173 RepID=A0A167BNT7_COLIC|nr:hypothetical protein CI238_07937 [Colletotrichum incanum]OHW90553.1 hypothetical protein CSPAE12_10817 [Colletotrichum incanum]
MSSKQTHPTSKHISVLRPRQGRTPQAYTYQQVGASSTLNSWLSEADSKAPFHAIGGYRPMAAASGSGANMWGSAPAPSSTGATWGSGQGDQK